MNLMAVVSTLGYFAVKKSRLSKLFLLDHAAGSLSDRFRSPIALGGSPRFREGRDVHQIVGDDAQAAPAMQALLAMVATAVEPMAAFEHTDTASQPTRHRCPRRNQRWRS